MAVAYLPVIVVGAEAFDQLAQLGVGVGAEAGHEAVEEQHKRDNGNEVGPEDSGPVERVNFWGQHQGEKGDDADAEDGFGVTSGGFEDGYAAVLFDGVGEDATGFGWAKVVEGREHGAEAVKVGWDFSGRNGSGVEGDRAVGFGLSLGEGFVVWVFVG